MKKILKISAIVLLSVILLIGIGVGILSHYMFSPDKLTPIVRKQTAKYFTCKTDIGEVELTFFSSFPTLSLRIDQLNLVGRESNGQDTIMAVEKAYMAVNVKDLLFKKHIKLEGLTIDGFKASISTDSSGYSNYNVLSPTLFSSEPDTTTSDSFEIPFDGIDLNEIILKKGSLSYINVPSKMNVAIDISKLDLNASLVENDFKGKMSLSVPKLSFNLDGETYLNSVPVKAKIPFNLGLQDMQIQLDKANLNLAGNGIFLEGTAGYNSENGDISTNLQFESEQWLIEKLLELVPDAFDSLLTGIDVKGVISVKGKVTGVYSEVQMPLCEVAVDFSDSDFEYAGLPIKMKDMSGNVAVYTDFLSDSISYVQLNSVKINTDKSSFVLNGRIDRIFSDMLCNLSADMDLDLVDAIPFVPDSMKIDVDGKIKGLAEAKLTVAQLESLDFGKMRISGSLDLENVKMLYDSMFVSTNSSKVNFSIPNQTRNGKADFMQIDLLSGDLLANIGDSIKADLSHTFLDLSISNFMDTTKLPNVICKFDIDNLSASMDTLGGAINEANGVFEMYFSPEDSLNPDIKFSCKAKNFSGNMGVFVSASVSSLNVVADVEIDDTKTELLDQFKASGMMDLEQALIKTDAFTEVIQIPSIKFDFKPEKYTIKESHFVIDRSDFNLSGELFDVAAYLRNEGLLRGSFDFESDTTDLNSLMALTSGIGTEEADTTTVAETADSAPTSGPFMVPKGMDILLRANIKQAYFGPDSATDIQGDVRLKDGILVLDSVRVTTPATRILLTALYRTPRKNHLFMGLDLHMLDVEIGELLTMIPDIDSIMPMLRSFGGSGEFHMAIETYLDSLYNLKMSTLRGAASVQGQNLVLMDGETFSQIANTLQFSKAAVNKVDSLSAEFTIFKNEIDVYPFLIVMDRYKAVVGGRHNLDMSFDYHISVTDSPLPFRLGVDVKGNLDDMKFRPAACKYAALYRPVRRKEVDRSQLELRSMIRKALTEGVVK